MQGQRRHQLHALEHMSIVVAPLRQRMEALDQSLTAQSATSVTRTGGFVARRGTGDVRYPRRSAGGLCLASTAPLVPREECQLWRRSTDTSGTSDKRPVLLQHAGQGAFCVDHECFTRAWTRYAWNPATRDCEATRRPARLASSEPECLSLHGSLLFVRTKNGKGRKENGDVLAHTSSLCVGTSCSCACPHADKRPFLPRLCVGSLLATVMKTGQGHSVTLRQG